MSEFWVDEIPEEIPHLLVCDGTDEWSALYVDGHLERVGDHYLIDERIRELAGVVTLQTNDFLRGGNHREDVADTVSQIQVYRTQRQDRETQAADLRLQAKQLMERAGKLERGGV